MQLHRESICGVRTAVERCKKKKDTTLRKYCSTTTLSLIDKQHSSDSTTSGQGVVVPPQIKVTTGYRSGTFKFTTGQLDHRGAVTITTAASTSGGDVGVGEGEGEGEGGGGSWKYIGVYPLCKYR